jgi:predicted nucleotidyltransferase/DNA-binding XRE family transcriptional regulator
MPKSSAELLRSARSRAGLTQNELAARAHVSQSVISAYENGQREPALRTLAALVAATGFDLDVRLSRQPDALSRLTGPLGARLRQRRSDVVRSAAAHGIANLRVFGSVARGEDRPDSDVDLLVDLPEGIGIRQLGRARADLEKILRARVDLVPAADLKPDVVARVHADLVAL